MSLVLYQHPLASFCHKVLLALYENDTPFENVIVDLADKEASASFFAYWPIGKIPILRDERADRTIPETSVIIEYLHQVHPGPRSLLPANETERLDVRLWDRFFDLYVQTPMQKIVGDRLRAPGEKDPRGVADAHAALATAYDMLERQLDERSWVCGEVFSMADCAAAPALFYAGIVSPFADGHSNVTAYFDRLAARPSFVRVIAEARPYFHFFPFAEAIPSRFLSQAVAS